MTTFDIIDFLKGKKILLLGYGREGESSYRFIRKHLPDIELTIADKNTNIDPKKFNDSYLQFILGEHYLDSINNFDLVIKSPGISLKSIIQTIDKEKISSQTDLFLRAYAQQCIGVTGTKGKSTTSSLIYHIISNLNKNVVFGGNIGLPLFELIDNIEPQTYIVLELSSHQLEFIHQAPHIAILLNLFEEHLDHYNTYLDYQKAKYNIALCQNKDDFFVYNIDDERIMNLIRNQHFVSFSKGFSVNDINNSYCYFNDNHIVVNDKRQKILPLNTEIFPLKGIHNYANLTAVVAAISCLENVNIEDIMQFLPTFQPLKHRLENIGTYQGITFYNDSISTIPQATIAAVDALENVDTLILGGMDRGIDYQSLVDYFSNKKVRNFIFTGKAGERMMHLFKQKGIKELFFKDTYPEIVDLAKQITSKGKICLLSPAAASYDSFRNFEHRGDCFRELVRRNH